MQNLLTHTAQPQLLLRKASSPILEKLLITLDHR